MNQAEREYREAMDNLRFSDKEKERIMNNLMNQENQNSKTRRIPLRTAVLAAALAVGCVLSIAAGLPARVYNFMTGGTMTALPGTGEVFFDDGYAGAEEDSPVTAEDGRLWFEADGQKLDITDKVDENTPYIHERTDPATGEKGYVIVGGTADNFGWAELIQMDDACAISGSNFAEPGKLELMEPVANEDGVFMAEEGSGGVCQMVESGAYRPWFQAALDQLGLEY